MNFRIAAALLIVFQAVNAGAQSTIEWTGGGDGVNWNDAANWSPQQVPGSADHAVIGGSGTYTVTMNANAVIARLTVGGSAGQQTLDTNNRTVTVSETATISANGVLFLSGGTFGATQGATVDGSFVWHSGYLDGQLLATNEATLTSSGAKSLRGRLENTGSMVWDEGPIYLYDQQMLLNSGTFEIANAANLNLYRYAGNGPWTFRNTGTLIKSGPGTFTAANTNELLGNVVVQEGALLINHNATWENTNISISAGASITLGGGTHTIVGTLTGSPEGDLFSSNAVIQTDAGGSAFNLGGTGFQWIGGYIDGETPLVNKASMSIRPASSASIRGNLTNEGSLLWDSGQLYLYVDQTLLNTGTFEIATDQNQNLYRYAGNGPWTLRNTGTLIKSGDAKLTIATNSEMLGTVSVQAGTLEANFNATWDNTTISVASGALLDLRGGTHTIMGTLSGNPEGDLTASNASVQTDAGGSTLNFGGTGFQWTGGFIDGSTPLVNEGLMRIRPTSSASLRGNLTNNGSLLWDRGQLYLYVDQTLLNTGTFEIGSDQNHNLYRYAGNGPWTLRNTGTMIKTGSGQLTLATTNEFLSDVSVEGGVLAVNFHSIWEDTNIAVAAGATLDLSGGTHTIRGTLTGTPEGDFVSTNATLQTETDGSFLNLGGTGFQWTGGFLDGDMPLVNLNAMRIAPTSSLSLRGNLTNEGDLLWDRGQVYIYDDQTLLNNGTFEIATDQNQNLYRYAGDGPWIFRNAGALVKSGSAQLSIAVNTIADGTIDVESGELSFAYDTYWPDGSVINVSDGAGATFRGGTHTFDGKVTGAIAGSLTLANNFVGTGSAELAFTGSGLAWESGYLVEGTVTNSGLMTVQGNSQSRGVRGQRSIFRNDGSIDWSDDGFIYIFDGAELVNAGSLAILGNANLRGLSTNGRFTNAATGTLRKSGDALFIIGTDIFRYPYYPRLEVALGGRVEFDGPVDVTGADVQDAAVHAVGGDDVNVVTWLGPLDLGRSSRLELGLGGTSPGPGGFDQVTVSEIAIANKSEDGASASETSAQDGVASLDGALDIQLIDAFQPSNGQSFDIIFATGFEGGFRDLSSLTIEDLTMSLYPSITDGYYRLTARSGIETLSALDSVTPTTAQNGQIVLVDLVGAGFSPDATMRLECVECVDPLNSGVVVGQIQSLSPTNGTVAFDLTKGDIFGSYKLVIADPRGGSAEVAFEVTDGPPILKIEAVDPIASEVKRDQGLFLVTASRPARTAFEIPFSLSGTATLFKDFVTDVLGGTLKIDPGRDSVYVSVFPLNDDEAESAESVAMQLDSAGPFDGSSSAIVTISDGPPSDEFAVLGSTPESGGSAGVVTVSVYGQGFAPDATFELIGAGPAIKPLAAAISDPSGKAITAVFALRGQPNGPRSIKVTSGSNTATLFDAFEIVAPVYPDVFVQVLAPPRVPRTRLRTYTVILKNRGNVDVTGYASLAGLPPDVEWELDEDSYNIIGGNGLTWRDVAARYQDDDTYAFALPQVTLRPGETRRMNIYTAVGTPQTLTLVAAWNYKRW
ncbi:MAG: hypothetical protein R2832_13515 [Rhodothermales bacterium]